MTVDYRTVEVGWNPGRTTGLRKLRHLARDVYAIEAKIQKAYPHAKAVR